jgi:integrase
MNNTVLLNEIKSLKELIKQNSNNIDICNNFSKENEKEMHNITDFKGTLRERNNGLLEFRFYKDFKQISIYGKNDKELVKKYHNCFKKNYKQKHIKSKSCIKFFEFIDKWFITYKKPYIAKSTIDNYNIYLNSFIKRNFKNKPLNQYNTIEIENYIANINGTSNQKYVCQITKAIFLKAIQLKIIKENPCEYIENKKHKVTNGQTLKLDEELKFINDIKNDKFKNCFLFLLYSGCRGKELLTLKWTDIDFNNKTIHIKGTKTNLSNRIIPMFKNLEIILNETNRNDEYVFPTKKITLQVHFKKYLPNRHMHELRHTFATRCCENNIPVKIVQKWLGHSTSKMTTDIYTHTTLEMEEKSLLKINNMQYP